MCPHFGQLVPPVRGLAGVGGRGRGEGESPGDPDRKPDPYFFVFNRVIERGGTPEA